MKFKVNRLFAALLCVAVWAGAPAVGPASPLPAEPPRIVAAAMVRDIVDGDTLVLDTGAQVRLVGIQAPKLPLGRPGFAAWPLAGEARDALAALSLGKQVALSYGGQPIDRWRRLLADVRTSEFWLQEEMLRRGLARVYTFADNVGSSAALYAAEDEARRAGRGIWRLAYYRILRPDEADTRIGTFQLVEGAPVAAAVVRGTGYLNFGADWRSDFTVSVSAPDMKRFRAAGVDLTSLTGQRLRVRGWITRRNGAMIRVTHPEQMEILDK